jgi:hypothetical protein
MEGQRDLRETSYFVQLSGSISMLHRERFNVLAFANENPAWNRDGGVLIQLQKKAQLR